MEKYKKCHDRLDQIIKIMIIVGDNNNNSNFKKILKIWFKDKSHKIKKTFQYMIIGKVA